MNLRVAFCILLAASLVGSEVFAQQRCAFESTTGINNKLSSTILVDRAVTTIPIVVHIIWNTADENISDAQIASQLEVLNEDYRRTNVEIPSIHPLFDDLSADMELEFCLVATTRTQTTISGIYNQFNSGKRRVCYDDEGGHDAISPDRYLNIWVSGRSDNALGSATAPGQTIAAEDGVFIDPAFFGTTANVAPPYDLGRTLTHEIGHYFGLQHLWGSGLENDNNCSGDDGIEDTPLQFGTYQGQCPAQLFTSCGSPDMHMNFMNFTDDACMAMFTNGQKAAVQSTLSGARSGLLTSDCLPLSSENLIADESVLLYPNPASDEIWVQLSTKDEYEITIFTTEGRLLSRYTQKNNPLLRLEITHFPRGIYYVKIARGKHFTMKKMIVL
jgi:hypothetical protein